LQEKDFDFIDEGLSVHKIDKRAITDDEDFLNDEIGSGKEGECTQSH
jgi:hypothetical protein